MYRVISRKDVECVGTSCSRISYLYGTEKWRFIRTISFDLLSTSELEVLVVDLKLFDDDDRVVLSSSDSTCSINVTKVSMSFSKTIIARLLKTVFNTVILCNFIYEFIIERSISMYLKNTSILSLYSSRYSSLLSLWIFCKTKSVISSLLRLRSSCSG